MAQASRSTFGKYVLLRKLASGGMGEIFLAKQRGPSGFEKLLVIKRILSHHLDKKDYLDMFFSEAKLVARLNHHNIIQIHEMGEIDGDYYIAMEYVRGKSMRDIIDELRAEGRFLPMPHVVDLAIKLCEGLGFAHQARDIRGRAMNIVHRDINPHNILISYTGDLKLIDFGIAKSEMTSVHTATGTIKGKFVYMSPEQSAADPIDRRSDIFSVGIVLYELCCLENPFVRQNVVLSLEAIQRHDVAVPSSKRPDAGALDVILAKALAKKPEERYQSATDMRDDLRNLFRDGTVSPADEDLGGFLSKLFTGDIAEEDRLLAEADQATTPVEGRVDAEPSPDLIDAGSIEAPAQHPAFADEEPTQAGDLEDIQQRSESRSNLFDHSGGGEVMEHQDEGGDLPHHNTRSDRIPKQSEAELVDEFPEEGATEVPPDRQTNPEVPLAEQEDEILSRTPMPNLKPKTPMPQAAFDEPLPPRAAPRALDPTREIDQSPPLLPESEPSPSYHITDEEQSQSSLTLPKPEWQRYARLSVYPLILVVTMFAGYQATRWVIGPPPEKKAVALVPLDEPDPVRPDVPDAAPTPDAGTAVTPTPPPIEEEEYQDEEIEDEPDSKKGGKKTKKATKPAKSERAEKAEREKAEKAEKAERKKVERAEKAEREKVERAEKAEREKAERAEKTERAEKAPPPPPVEPPPAEVKTEPKVDPEEAKKPTRLGTLTLRTSSQVAVEVEGRSAGSSPSSIAVKKQSGTIVLHGGAESGESKVTLTYRVEGEGVSIEVEAEPWAIAQNNGLSVGKTPQTLAASSKHKIGLLRPGQSGPLTISLSWSPTP